MLQDKKQQNQSQFKINKTERIEHGQKERHKNCCTLLK